jgi:hypothetical protein
MCAAPRDNHLRFSAFPVPYTAQIELSAFLHIEKGIAIA